MNDDFKTFLDSQNRLAFIQKFLNNRGLNTSVLQLDGKNHIYVKFPLNQYNSMFKVKTVVAHYDRAEGTAGANDNSAAVFCLMEWADRLNKACAFGQLSFHNVRLIFTDGEEEGKSGVKEQGAYAIASLFRKLNIMQDDVFVFDCMGRGTVPVICENNFPEKVSNSFKNRIIELENKLEKIVSTSNGGKWFKMQTSYSDNASFLANGIPAVALTMLPSDEIDLYMKEKIPPKTWELLHTPSDNLESLNPKSFEITEKILNNLAALRTLV